MKNRDQLFDKVFKIFNEIEPLQHEEFFNLITPEKASCLYSVECRDSCIKNIHTMPFRLLKYYREKTNKNTIVEHLITLSHMITP